MEEPELHPNWTEVDGLRWFARTAGEGPPVILVHGAVVSGRYMERAGRLLARRFQVWIPDLPGYGRSDKPDRVHTVPEMADALCRWMDAAGIESAHAAGNSMGCQVLLEFARRFPQRLRRMVLQGPTVDPSRRSGLRQISAVLHDAFLEPGMSIIFLRDYFDVGFVRALRTFRVALRDRPELRAPQVRVPTLVIRGEKDPLVSAGWALMLGEMLPSGELETIPGAAHTLNYTEAKRFVSAVECFLKGEQHKYMEP